MSAWEASEIKIPPKRGMGVLPPDAHPERFGFGYRLCSRVDAGVKPTCACKRACSGLSLLTWQYSRYENGVSPHHVAAQRSEEHTSELQSLMRTSYAVFCLKKKKIYIPCNIYSNNP